MDTRVFLLFSFFAVKDRIIGASRGPVNLGIKIPTQWVETSKAVRKGRLLIGNKTVLLTNVVTHIRNNITNPIIRKMKNLSDFMSAKAFK